MRCHFNFTSFFMPKHAKTQYHVCTLGNMLNNMKFLHVPTHISCKKKKKTCYRFSMVCNKENSTLPGHMVTVNCSAKRKNKKSPLLF